MKHCALTRGEAEVLRAIRLWRRNTAGLSEVRGSGRSSAVLALSIRDFIHFLWNSDPYAVQVRTLGDETFTLFELQLLYALSEQRSGNAAPAEELLEWWFPQSVFGEARTLLSKVSSALDALELGLNATGWVRAEILTITERRLRPASRIGFRHARRSDGRARRLTTLH